MAGTLARGTAPRTRAVVPSGGAPQRLALVDALRGIASLWVVLFHARQGEYLRELLRVLPRGVGAFLECGFLGVPIFFVLSGYVISHSVARHDVDGGFVARFIARRSVRLDPPYWGSMVLAVGVAAIYAALKNEAGFRPPTALEIAAHVAYLQDLLQVPSISFVYWTLCLEIQFYLAFCLLSWAMDSLRPRFGERARALLFGPVSLVAATWPALLLASPWPGSWLPTWYGFILGMLACWVARHVIPRWPFYLVAALVSVGAVRWALLGESTKALWPATCVATAVLLAEAGRAGKIATWLGWRPLQLLGLISYSLYLVHMPALRIAYGVHVVFGLSPLGNALSTLVALPLVLAGAAGFWWLVERPTQRLSQRIAPTRRRAPLSPCPPQAA